MLVRAEVGNGSLITVMLGSGTDEPEATVTFVTFGEEYDELVAQAEAELDSDESLSDFEREVMYQNVLEDAAEMTQEVLELGTFTDFDQLFDALAVAQVQATEWEELLVPLEDEFDYYDEEFDDEEFDDEDGDAAEDED